MTDTHSAIIITLASIARKYKKPYCFPSQEHILRLLKIHHKINLSRRTLNRHLKELTFECFFDRIRRHRRSKQGKLIFNTTLYKLRKKTFKFMYFLREQGQKFFSFFRVPFLAQYKAQSFQVSAGFYPESLSSSSKASKEVARSGPFIPDPPPLQLERLREFLKAIE